MVRAFSIVRCIYGLNELLICLSVDRLHQIVRFVSAHDLRKNAMTVVEVNKTRRAQRRRPRISRIQTVHRLVEVAATVEMATWESV